jgi:hypothetical protein
MREADPLPMGSIGERPTKLRGAAAKLWNDYISRAWWLTWADGPKARMWCHLQAEYDRAPAKMIASRIAQLRAVGAELGFDQAARARMGIPRNPADLRPSSPAVSSRAAKYLT